MTPEQRKAIDHLRDLANRNYWPEGAAAIDALLSHTRNGGTMTPEQLDTCWKHGDALAKAKDPDGGMIKELVAEVGMMRESLRDRFAMAALTGLVAYSLPEPASRVAYEYAAHMLTARSKATGGMEG